MAVAASRARDATGAANLVMRWSFGLPPSRPKHAARSRIGRVWKSKAFVTTFKNEAYGFDPVRAQSPGGSDGIFPVSRQYPDEALAMVPAKREVNITDGLERLLWIE
jgi:hypothetical protein